MTTAEARLRLRRWEVRTLERWWQRGARRKMPPSPHVEARLRVVFELFALQRDLAEFIRRQS
jgi:hypothetical protein